MNISDISPLFTTLRRYSYLYSLSFSQDAECRLVAMMSEHSVMGFGRKAKIPVVQETTMDTDGIGGDDIVTPPGK